MFRKLALCAGAMFVVTDSSYAAGVIVSCYYSSKPSVRHEWLVKYDDVLDLNTAERVDGLEINSIELNSKRISWIIHNIDNEAMKAVFKIDRVSHRMVVTFSAPNAHDSVETGYCQ